MNRILRAAILSLLVLTACLAVSEVGRRVLDGYSVWNLELVIDPDSTDLTWSDGRSTEALLRSIRLDIEADPSWFYDRPEPLKSTAAEWAEKRRLSIDPAANYIWNAATIRHAALQSYLEKNKARLEEIFTFRSPGGDPYPNYRLYPAIQTGFGFTNQFGWRSKQIAVEKPPDVIRIGVLGDSTTNAYPGMVEHWLNLWAERRKLGVRFEVVNASRPATGALDAAAILEFELSYVDVDYVIIYGFGNGIYAADALIPLPPQIVKGQPGSAGVAQTGMVAGLSPWVGAQLEPLARRSAAASFLRSRLMGQRGSTLAAEPPKPVTRLEFPPGIDEDSPDPATIASHASGGLMALETYLRGLDKMDAVAKKQGIRLFVSTFRIMAFEGMLLGKGDPNNGGIIYSVLNEQYWWPYTYGQIRRFIAFYNRALRAWAESKGQDIMPIDEQMPWRPELYGDGTHELPAGEALHAWIVLQQLMPKIREDLAQGRLPQAVDDRRPDLDQYWRIERMTVAEAMAPTPPSTAPDFPIVIAPKSDPPPKPADDVPGAFPLAKIELAYAKAEVVPGDVPLIRTAMEPTAYAASIPVEASLVARLAGRGWVGVRLRVNQGGVTVGVLNKSAQRFLAYSNLTQGPEIQEVYLPIEKLSDIGSLMISNYRPGETARSVAELHGVVLKRFRQ